MKLNQLWEELDRLDEANIKGMKQLAKKHKDFSILYHQDSDGIMSALCLKHILQNEYGLKLRSVQMIQYGGNEFKIEKGWDKDTLIVLCDFSKGKPFINIWTDHHSSQKGIKSGTSTSFVDAPANAYHLSAEISKRVLSPMEDLEIISTVDSADFYKHGLKPDDIMRAAFGYDENLSVKDNHWRMGLVVNKLLLSYKNKPDFLNKLVKQANPSLISMYNVIRRLAKKEGYRAPEEIEQHQDNYNAQQKQSITDVVTSRDIKNFKDGQNGIVKDRIIVQYGGGKMFPSKGLQYDRYTVFKNHPDAKFLVIGWPLGMVQISGNPFKEKNTKINFQEVAEGVLDNYKSELQNNISNFSYIKKKYEEDITKKNLNDAIGFTFEDLLTQFSKDQIKGMDIGKEGSWKDTIKNIASVHWKDLTDKQKDVLENIKVSAWDIIKQSSGGHSTSIWNISGLNFIGKGYPDMIKQIMSDITRELVKRSE